MSNEKPEAIELADHFEKWAKCLGEHELGSRTRCAKELRSLHARVQELEAMLEAPQPQADALDAERYRWLRDKWLGNEPEAINMERAKGQRGLDAAIDAAIAKATGRADSVDGSQKGTP